MAICATNIRRGMAIMFDNAPCRVIDFHHHTPERRFSKPNC
jgi:translation elongation factor P/translation initiation factor 5A